MTARVKIHGIYIENDWTTCTFTAIARAMNIVMAVMIMIISKSTSVLAVDDIDINNYDINDTISGEIIVMIKIRSNIIEAFQLSVPSECLTPWCVSLWCFQTPCIALRTNWKDVSECASTAILCVFQMPLEILYYLKCLWNCCTTSLSSLWRRIWKDWTFKMLARYIPSSACLRLSKFSQISFMQSVGLCVSSLPISLVMIVRICVLYLINKS